VIETLEYIIIALMAPGNRCHRLNLELSRRKIQSMKKIKLTLSLIAAFVTTSAVLAGCGATVKQAEEISPRVEAATAAFGPGFDYMIVEPDSKLGDTLFVGFFGGVISSDLSRQLFVRMATAAEEGKPFLVTGERGEKTAQVINQALFRAPDNSMPDLELLYLGEEQYVEGIEESVKRVGGTMRFAPYPG
jgi:predicted small secreted protein